MGANATLVGRLGRDPETSEAGTGTKITRLAVATTTRTKGRDGQWTELTTWWKATLFGQQADYAAQHLGKGDLVEVVGEVSLRPWTGNDGTERQELECRASSVSRLVKAGEGKAPARSEAAPARTAPAPAQYNSDEPPF